MYARVKGQCVFIAEPRQVIIAGKPPSMVQEFAILCQVAKQSPEVVKVVSWNGYKPKLNEQAEFDARITIREFKGKSSIQCEVV